MTSNGGLQRPEPLWLQLVAHYRTAIRTGEIASGTRLPPVREIAEQHGVSFNTVGKVMRALAAEFLVETSNQGTVVTFGQGATFGPRERLSVMQRNPDRIYPSGESTIVASEVTTAPEHVAAMMGLETGAAVVRRERVTVDEQGVPVTASVSWLPGDLADAAPELLTLEPIPGGTPGAIKRATGKELNKMAASARECARRATAAEADRLRVAEGAPVLAGENVWPDADGNVMEFGQYVIPEGRWIPEGPWEWADDTA
ncbi:GntR family transcriptional regulator [Nocardia sp. CC201C]|uniref:GntR family transcriptional regulator n=1 Tax=Nocardia sp. CC201C TaxID=3044575 RepID=UPI0024A9474A|nr:GntR family transcriptional regulator [Nocardia sp. CC201C]